MLLYLVIAFLIGAGSCSSYDVQKTPDQIFTDYFAVGRLRSTTRGGKTNVTVVLNLLKNGTEVAKKVQGVFEKVQKLQDGPIDATEVLELGQEVYKVGKQAYDVGKQAYEVGKNVLDVGKGFLEKHKNLMEVGKTMGKTLANIAKFIGPALGGIGIAFAIISAFVPADPSPELLAIQKGFKEMHERFDQVSNQIKMLESKIDFYQAIKPYQDVRDSLKNVHRNYLNVIGAPTSPGFKNDFKEACRDRSVEPLQALEKLHRIIVNPGPEDQPHMIKTIIEQHKLEYKTIMGWFERITQNAYTLGMLRSACFGALHGEDDPGRGYTLNQTESWIIEIISELAKYEEKFTNLDQEFIHVLKNELENLPSNNDPTAEQEVNQRCDIIEANLTGSNAICRGDRQVNAKRIAVNHQLNSKYYWFNWMVMVYEKPENDQGIPCDTPPGTNWLLIKKDPRVLVAWSRKDAFEAARLRQKAQEFLVDRLKEFKPFFADAYGSYYGQNGKYNIIFNIKMNDWIRDWMNNESYTNKTWCSFGGYTGDYHRAITTSGIAAHRSQVARRYIIDYLLLFW